MSAAQEPLRERSLPDLTNLPAPSVSLTKEELVRFRENYRRLGEWAARICGVPFETMCEVDLLRTERDIADLIEVAENALRLFVEFRGWTQDSLPHIRETSDALRAALDRLKGGPKPG